MERLDEIRARYNAVAENGITTGQAAIDCLWNYCTDIPWLVAELAAKDAEIARLTELTSHLGVCEDCHSEHETRMDCRDVKIEQLRTENATLRKAIGKDADWAIEAIELRKEAAQDKAEYFKSLTADRDRLVEYESTIPIETARQWAKAWDDGRLVVLPPIKDATIYIIEEIPETNERWVTNRPVNYFDITGLYCGFGLAQMRYDFADMGDKWFLAHDEAEAALERRVQQ